MANNGAKVLGVTPPLSTALPTDAENQASNALIEELKRQNNYESAADTHKRTEVLKSLQAITLEFVKQVGRKQGLNESVLKNLGGKVFTFGSFRLGVFGPGSDIDTLVVGPARVSRDDFFDYFPELLQKMAPEGAITDLTPVRDSFVPILSFDYSGISIDLLYTKILRDQIPLSFDLQDSDLLKGLDDVDLRSVNGTRVTDAILNLVPQKAIFRTALRGIKLWAQRRAIYANIMGFPGGVAWAMLVARICQLYPKATSSVIILKFFRIMEQWQWPMPVLLTPIESRADMSVRVWNPKLYPGDRYHLMPIITPAFPSMCATHNITRSTKEIIHRELKRAGMITDQIMLGKAQWKDLFVKHTFFTQGYKYYLSIISASTTKDAQNIWSGRVESKVRTLVSGLEGHDSIALAHPYTKGFERVHECKGDEAIDKVKSGSLAYLLKETPATTGKDGSDTVSNGTEPKITTVYTTTFYIGLELKPGAKSLDLSAQVEAFTKFCTEWERYDKELNALTVIHTKNTDLPDDVFEPGEIRPTRNNKKKAANGEVKKRNAAEDPATEPAPKRQQTSVVAAG